MGHVHRYRRATCHLWSSGSSNWPKASASAAAFHPGRLRIMEQQASAGELADKNATAVVTAGRRREHE
jgi:hypothetical protein